MGWVNKTIDYMKGFYELLHPIQKGKKNMLYVYMRKGIYSRLSIGKQVLLYTQRQHRRQVTPFHRLQCKGLEPVFSRLSIIIEL